MLHTIYYILVRARPVRVARARATEACGRRNSGTYLRGTSPPEKTNLLTPQEFTP